MSIKEKVLKRMHESKDRIICMNIVEIKTKYTEPSYQIYFI